MWCHYFDSNLQKTSQELPEVFKKQKLLLLLHHWLPVMQSGSGIHREDLLLANSILVISWKAQPSGYMSHSRHHWYTYKIQWYNKKRN